MRGQWNDHMGDVYGESDEGWKRHDWNVRLHRENGRKG